jgi:S-adenosylmethionine/arginine decarboxylase-like enzyme
MSTYWGFHTMLDCAGCNHESITNGEHITAFIKDLVKRIDMIAYGEPMVEHFATHDPIKAGWSAVQLIETSNICMHAVDADDTLYLDVFSCKEYDPQTVIDIVKEYFEAQTIRLNYITRQA